MRACMVGAAILIAPLTVCAALPDCLLGRWRSSEALTLTSMREVPDLNPKAREMFEKDFFGHLIVVFTPTRWGGIYLRAEKPEFESALVEVISSTHSSVVLRSEFLGSIQEREWRCGDGSISTPTSRFREYFVKD